MSNRSGDWMDQALRDLEQAGASQRDGRHEWACFAAQQAAKKAIKALHLARGQEAWGHVVARLLRELPLAAPEDLVEKGKVLDNFYVASRYPNGHPEGAPF
ncbi:MAG: HEPN domain-containing protein, partial [Planctomycetota bacterium]